MQNESNSPVPGGSDIREADFRAGFCAGAEFQGWSDSSGCDHQFAKAQRQALEKYFLAQPKDQDGSALASPTRSASEIWEVPTLPCPFAGRRYLNIGEVLRVGDMYPTHESFAGLAPTKNPGHLVDKAFWYVRLIEPETSESESAEAQPEPSQPPLMTHVAADRDMAPPGAPGAGDLEVLKQWSECLGEGSTVRKLILSICDELARLRSTPQQGREWTLKGYAYLDTVMVSAESGPKLKLGEAVKVREVEAPEQKDHT